MTSKDGWRNSSRQLTDKHKELLPHLAADKGDAAIARSIGITPNSVHCRIERMMDIVKCADRDELVQYAKEYVKSEESRIDG